MVLLEGFNLVVIEVLVVSRAQLSLSIRKRKRHSFNLVIEVLVVSSLPAGSHTVRALTLGISVSEVFCPNHRYQKYSKENVKARLIGFPALL